MEQAYTKEQLIKAQQKYNLNVATNPNDFAPYNVNAIDEQTAIEQIEYLLSLIESE